MAVSAKIKKEFGIFRKQVTWLEYALWWAARIALLYALIRAVTGKMSGILILQLKAELALLFVFPALHLLPRSIFIARLSYRAQDAIVVMLFTTAYFGQYKGFYSTVEWYDAYMHILGCFVCVFAGYALTVSLKHDSLPLAPVVAAMCGFGFSFFFAAGWEIFEFICDIVTPSNNTQNWAASNSEHIIALLPEMDPRRYALLDTMSDLVTGAVGSLLGGVSLFVYACVKNKKSAAPVEAGARAAETRRQQDKKPDAAVV